MKNMKRKLSALVLTTLFASMQMSYAIDTNLGAGNGGAVINSTTGGYVDMTKGVGSATLNFNGDAHVNWDTLNVNRGEALNFNAVNGATNLTILNTVNRGMSNIYGKISANEGIGKLIISNPNGMLFNGATFDAAGDVMLTTQPMNAAFINGKIDITNLPTTDTVGMITIKDSNFSVGGEFNILAPTIEMTAGYVNANNGLKLITKNGQDYLATGNVAETKGVKLHAINVDGDVYIVGDKGLINLTDGGRIDGNLNVDSDYSVALNYTSNGKALEVTGDVDVTGNGVFVYARNTKVGGNLNLENGGGFLEVGNVQVGKDMNLKTVAKSENNKGYKHFVHILGHNYVKGNVNVDSRHNVHIGNYNFEEKRLLDGSLTVDGDLNVHAHAGHVMVTVNTKADKISLKSDLLNVLSDKNSTLTANEYEFSSNGYIGAVQGFDGYTDAQVIIDLMENYEFIPAAHQCAAYMNIAGGEITNITTPVQAYVNIASKGDLKLTGANAGQINITAPDKFIEITGPNVHAKEINVGNETDTLKVDFPERDYTLNYTNIRDGILTTVGKTEEITYELTNGENGYNTIAERPANTTYLVGPEKPVTPEPTPDEPTPVEPTPDPVINPQDNDNVKVLKGYERYDDANKAQPYTPVAYAADLDDDSVDTGVRKNVDGSVTVVRAYPMGK